MGSAYSRAQNLDYDALGDSAINGHEKKILSGNSDLIVDGAGIGDRQLVHPSNFHIAIEDEKDSYTMWDAQSFRDVFIHFYGFLPLADRSRCAAVSQMWRQASYDPSLWQSLNLSRFKFRVSDELVVSLLSSKRFKQLNLLNVEGCAAITDTSLTAISKVSSLRTLKLSGCDRISERGVVRLAQELELESLEIDGCNLDSALAEPLAQIRPRMDTGVLWMRYCATNGISGVPEAQTRPECRYMGGFGGRGCWGGVHGRIVYSNQGIQRRRGIIYGNYPSEVIYTCVSHNTATASDTTVFTCMACFKIFRRNSMCVESSVCKVCMDGEILREGSKWIDLESKRWRQQAANLTTQDVHLKAVTLTDRRNLPETLKSYGSLRFMRPSPIDQNNGRRDEQPGPDADPLQQRLGRVFTVANNRLVDANTASSTNMPDRKIGQVYLVEAEEDADGVAWLPAWADEKQEDDEKEKGNEMHKMGKPESQHKLWDGKQRSLQKLRGMMLREGLKGEITGDSGLSGGVSPADHGLHFDLKDGKYSNISGIEAESKAGVSSSQRTRLSELPLKDYKTSDLLGTRLEGFPRSNGNALLDIGGQDEEGDEASHLDDYIIDEDDQRRRLVPETSEPGSPIDVKTERLEHDDLQFFNSDPQINAVINGLERARNDGQTRAILCYDERHEEVEVMADKQLILSGHREHEKMEITLKTIRHFYFVLYPFLTVMLVVAYFQAAFDGQKQAPQRHAQNNQLSERHTHREDDTQIILILAAVFFVVVIAMVYMIYRFRQVCERIFRRFLVIDILMIYLFGGATMILIALMRLQILVGTDTYAILAWNLACGGLASLYLKLPESLRRFYLIVLSGIMAVMMVITLPWIFLLIFLSLASLMDLASGLHRRLRVFGPFISSDREIVPFNTPKIFYEVPGLRFRFANLFTYGLLIGCIPVGTSIMTSSFVMALAGLILGLYVLPFNQVHIRPLPMSMAGLVFFAYTHYVMIRPYARSINFLLPSQDAWATSLA